MQLWVRSQDKNLLIPINKPISQFCEGLFYDGTILGTYKTKERALEVLNEIQNILKSKTMIIDSGNPIECSNGGFVYLNQKTKLEYQQVGTYVYEMPQE